MSMIFLSQPERINPEASSQGYGIRSDVWSLGITIVSQLISTFDRTSITLAGYFGGLIVGFCKEESS